MFPIRRMKWRFGTSHGEKFSAPMRPARAPASGIPSTFDNTPKSVTPGDDSSLGGRRSSLAMQIAYRFIEGGTGVAACGGKAVPARTLCESGQRIPSGGKTDGGFPVHLSPLKSSDSRLPRASTGGPGDQEESGFRATWIGNELTDTVERNRIQERQILLTSCPSCCKAPWQVAAVRISSRGGPHRLSCLP